jgi:hypothetical protein
MELPESYIDDYNKKITNMNESQRKVFKAIEHLKHYINTYDCQYEYINYSEQTIIEDIIYGLGSSLNKVEYSFATGLTKFKQVIYNHIKPFIQIKD